MSDKPLQLKVKIDKCRVVVGDGQLAENEIVLTITNQSGEAVSYGGFGADADFSLLFSIGSEEGDFFGTDDELNDITIDVPDGWTAAQSSDPGTYIFDLPTQPKTVFDATESKIVTLSNFETSAVPGMAQMKIRFVMTGYETYETMVSVEKNGEQLAILDFTANPPFIVSESDRQAFRLNWNVVDAGKIELFKMGQLLQRYESGKNGAKNGEFTYQDDKPDLSGTVYRLVATGKDDEKRTVESQVSVAVLNPGWHSLAGLSRYGDPASLIDAAQTQLYGIFVKNGKGVLYSSMQPWVAWNVIGELEGMIATSPAVWFDNSLWLIGGSRSDTTACSNKVWQFKDGSWTQQTNASFSARMGHACVAFGEKLWMMGGRDAFGNALNDIWSLDKNGVWKEECHASPWSARCMFAATVFDSKLWIYGGFDEAFANSRQDMWCSRDGQKWDEYKEVPRINFSYACPISCALFAMNGNLQLIGSFKSGNTIEQLYFTLFKEQQRWLKSDISVSWNPRNLNTHGLSAVAFDGLTYVHSLGSESDNEATRMVLYKPNLS